MALLNRYHTPQFHRSPLLTRLDVFDGCRFDLTYHRYSIGNEINECDNPSLIKIDVDPVDVLKLGFIWKEQYYADISIAFRWVLGRAAFQLLADAITFIMKAKGFKILLTLTIISRR